MIKVSIILPIYNVEVYLERSIESVRHQTLQELEIILVNDGSEDGSLKICKEYEKKDKRIRVIDKCNGGVSSARNAGLKIANGKYIAFLDPDDYVEINMYERMYNKIIENNNDMCMCNYIIMNEGKQIHIENNLEEEVISQDRIKSYVIPQLVGAERITEKKGMERFRSNWIYLYKKEVIDKNNLKFIEGLAIGEDFLFNLDYMEKIKRIVIDRNYYYYYCINNNSIMKKYKKNSWEIYKTIINELNKRFPSENQRYNIAQRLNVIKIKYFLDVIINECNNLNNRFINKIIKLNNIFNDDEIKGAVNNYVYTNSHIKDNVILFLLRNNCIILLYIYYKIRASNRW
ncbi:MAG: glycosyltransferase [Cellulosilyticaceae bacterium]